VISTSLVASIVDVIVSVSGSVSTNVVVVSLVEVVIRPWTAVIVLVSIVVVVSITSDAVVVVVVRTVSIDVEVKDSVRLTVKVLSMVVKLCGKVVVVFMFLVTSTVEVIVRDITLRRVVVTVFVLIDVEKSVVRSVEILVMMEVLVMVGFVIMQEHPSETEATG
jgi:hypothetical protein